MSSLNHVTLMGRLGKDPEQRSTQGGKSIVKFSLATDSGFGEKKTTDWHNIVCFDKLGEAVSRYLAKGCRALVTGRIRYNKWQKDDGTTAYITEIIADEVQFIDPASSQQPAKPAFRNGPSPSPNGPGDVASYEPWNDPTGVPF